MYKIKYLLLIILFITANLFSLQDITKIKSDYSYYKTVKNIQFQLTKNDFVILKNMEYLHKNNNIKLKNLPSTLIIFSKKPLEKKFMRLNRQAALEFPFKILIWKDKKNRVWVSYKNLNILTKYNIPFSTVKNLNLSLHKMVTQAVRKNTNLRKLQKTKEGKILKRKLEKN